MSEQSAESGDAEFHCDHCGSDTHDNVACDPNPQYVGPRYTNVRQEFDVIEDRTSKGLGTCLLATYSTLGMAAWRVHERLAQGYGCPVIVKVRTVATTDWRDVRIPPG